MDLKNIFAVAILLLFISTTYAQQQKMDFGKIPAADLVMESYDPEPDAEAVVLGHTLGLELVFSSKSKMFYSYHKRTKIFKESAFDLGTVKLYYYAAENTEDIKRLRAIIHYPDGTQYKLDKKEFYKEEYDDKYKSITFTFPKLSEGCIIEYKYDMISENISVLDDFNYQEKYPVRYAHMEFDIPTTIDYMFINKGNPQGIERDGDIMFMDTIPSMKSESYVTTMSDYRGALKMQVRGYTDGYGQYHPVLSSWDKITEGLEENRYFGEQYLKTFSHKAILKEVKPMVDESLKGEALLLALQKTVLDKVTCNYDSGIYSTDGIKNAWKLGEANCSEMNFIMISLLREYGMKAHPMLVSKRSHGKVFSTYPFINQFSYAIVYTIVDGKEYLLDISDKHRPPGMVSFEALNKEGFVVNSQGGGWRLVPAQKGMDAFYCQFTIKDKVMKGSIKGKYSSYNALPERRLYEDEEEGKHWEKRLQEKFPATEVEEVTFDEGDNIYTPLKDEVTVEIPDACVVAGDLMYIDPYVYSNYTENPFKLTERNFPVDFGNPRGENYVFVLEIPEGYEIEELPEGTAIATEDRMALYQLSCKKMGNKIMVNRKVDFKKPEYSPTEYQALKQIFDMLLEKDGEQIVLKKS